MYSALFRVLSLYWREYGGWRELLASPFLHLAIFATVVYGAGSLDFAWREFAIESLPTILGLSLAAYAITFSLMGSALHRALSAAVDERLEIPLIKVVNSTFFHVLFCQLLALVFAVFYNGTAYSDLVGLLGLENNTSKVLVVSGVYFGDVFGFFLTIYATFLLLSIGLAMFRLGRLNSIDKGQKSNQGSPANDDGPSRELDLEVMETWRFKFVAWLSKKLGLYEEG